MLGGLGFWEIAAILVVALLVFGPKKLPELARNLGKGIREFKKATSDFRSSVDYELHQPEPTPPAKQVEATPAKQLESQVDEAEVIPADAPAASDASSAPEEAPLEAAATPPTKETSPS